jgi:hypothetical protein
LLFSLYFEHNFLFFGGFQKAIKRKVNFEESKKFKEKLQAYRKELAEQEESATQ